MATHNTLINNQSAKAHPQGVALALELPWYRSLWLSAVTNIALTLNGNEINKDQLSLELNGKTYPISTLPEQWETLWFIQDHPLLVANLDNPIPEGSDIDVAITFELRVLYMQIAPEKYVTNLVNMHKTLTVH